MDSDALTATVHALQITVVTALIFLSGLSSCLSLWVMPLTRLLPPRQAAHQFQQTFTWGAQYLQPSSRILGALLLLTTFLTSNLPDPVEAAKWKDWAVCLALLIPVAPYEIWFIFWINDRVKGIIVELDRDGGKEKDQARKGELRELIGMWQRRNFGRVACPLAVGVFGLLSIVG